MKKRFFFLIFLIFCVTFLKIFKIFSTYYIFLFLNSSLCDTLNLLFCEAGCAYLL